MTAELLSPRFQAASSPRDQWGASGRVIDAGGAGGSGTARHGETVEVAYDKRTGDETRPSEGELFLFLPHYEVS